MPLEFEITGDTCAIKIKVLRASYVSPEEEKCRNICNGNYKFCERYIPVSKTALPIRQGRYAFAILQPLDFLK